MNKQIFIQVMLQDIEDLKKQKDAIDQRIIEIQDEIKRVMK